MATIREYVETKLARFGLDLTDAELTVLQDLNGVDDNTLLDSDTLKIAEQILVSAIPELLLLPDVTEGGLSIKRDRGAITAYYSHLCSKHGFVNQLTPAKPKLTDASNRW